MAVSSRLFFIATSPPADLPMPPEPSASWGDSFSSSPHDGRSRISWVLLGQHTIEHTKTLSYNALGSKFQAPTVVRLTSKNNRLIDNLSNDAMLLSYTIRNYYTRLACANLKKYYPTFTECTVWPLLMLSATLSMPVRSRSDLRFSISCIRN